MNRRIPNGTYGGVRGRGLAAPSYLIIEANQRWFKLKEYEHEFVEHIYYSASEFEKRGGIWPVRAGRNEAKSTYSVGPKIIECYSFHFVKSGSVHLEYKDGAVTLKEGGLFCLYPHLKYQYRGFDSLAESSPPLRMYWLAFNGAQVPQLLDRLSLTRERPYLRNKVTPELEATLKQMLLYMHHPGHGDEYRLQSILYQLFGLLNDNQSDYHKDKGGENWLTACLNHMNMHYMEGITVADIVRIAGVHRSHLYSEFVRLCGMGPKQYLIKLRMERAAEMLKMRTYTVTEIALSLGYPDLYVFSRAFCTYHGVPPSRFDKNPTK
jgi:AraC-like DNA-binding protein